MIATVHPNRKDSRQPRADGEEARARLLHAALRMFAEHGYAKTSTRDIAQAADTNIASIKYYFGDKAGLYRAVFTEPLGCTSDDIPFYDQPHFSLRESLEGFFNSFLAPLKQDELVQLCIRLHFREMLEPTGLWAEEISNGINPAHAALVAVLSRHLGLTRADDDLHRLAFSIVGLALQLFVARDVIAAIRAQLIGTPAAIDRWAARMVDYAVAMLEAEAARRMAASSAASKPVKKIR
jgi:TetR/AcrR family transcriptional regulator, regulator of cefoperazone and chloramphenicol sensitivity